MISEVNQQEVASIAELTERIDAAKEAGRPRGVVQGDRPGRDEPVRRDQAGLGRLIR